MSTLSITMLTNFLKASRGQVSTEVIKRFLDLVIRRSDLSQSGSILVYKATDNKLHLFNDQDFLFEEGFLERGQDWKFEFKENEGLAGLAFTTRETQFSKDVQNDPRFSREDGDSPVEEMVCVPIVVTPLGKPFGVVSFHNSEKGPTFEESDIELVEACSHALSLALEVALPQANQIERSGVFIVHGRDVVTVNALKVILLERSVQPILLQEKARTGAEILQMLEETINKCGAGFVLLTPDDEGRLRPEFSGKQDEPYQGRARQNVVFEGGMLVERYRMQRRVCFLKRGSIELPSDIEGLMYEEFDPKNPDVTRIENILTEWGISWSRK